MILEHKALDFFYDSSESHYQLLREKPSNQMILHYTGDLNYGFANAIAGRLEKLLALHIKEKQARKRFFSVFVEAVQNIRLHGCTDSDDRVHAGLNVYTNNGRLLADFMNIVTKAQGKLLTQRYTEANTLPRSELKSKYLEVMQNGTFSGKGGASLGIITIVLRSQNRSPFWLKPIDDIFEVFTSQIVVNLV